MLRPSFVALLLLAGAGAHIAAESQVVSVSTSDRRVRSMPGPMGPAGPPGAPGTNGTNGKDGTSTPGTTGAAGTPGRDGADGTNGKDGAAGTAATIRVGTVASGSAAAVVNSGTPSAAVLDFVLPRGADGKDGRDGSDGGPGTPGTPGRNGTDGKDGVGTPGPAGPAGRDGASVTGPAGPAGPAGPGATIAIGAVSTGAPGSAVQITNSGPPSAAIWNVTIPRGADGKDGAPGAAGTVGATGATGATGAAGPAGPAGAGATYLPNATITETATIAIVLGPRSATVPVAGLLVGDRVIITPAAAPPAGYILGLAYCLTAGVLTVDYYGPAIALGATRSIPLRVAVLR